MYFWLKTAHIASMLVWFTGLFLLPRLFVARTRPSPDGRPTHFNIAANTLYFRIMTPAGAIAITLGMVLMAYLPFGAWLVLKLLVVMLAVMLHLYLGLVLYRLAHDGPRHGPAFFRMLGWVVAGLLLVIAALTGAKPATLGLFPPPPGYPADTVSVHREGGASSSAVSFSEASPATPMPWRKLRVPPSQPTTITATRVAPASTTPQG